MSEGTVGLVGGLVCACQLVLMIASIFPTEWQLKKNFDQNGLRKESQL